MKDRLLKLSATLQILKDESGQDLIAATAGMSTLATAINTAFNHVGTTLGSYIP